MRAQRCAAPQASITTQMPFCFSKNELNSLRRNLQLDLQLSSLVHPVDLEHRLRLYPDRSC